MQLLFLVKEATVNRRRQDVVIFYHASKQRNLFDLRIPPFLDPNLRGSSIVKRPWGNDRIHAAPWTKEFIGKNGQLLRIPSSCRN